MQTLTASVFLAYNKWMGTFYYFGFSWKDIYSKEQLLEKTKEDEEIYSLMQTVRVNKKDVDKNYKGEPGKVDTFDSTSRESMERWADRFEKHPKLVINSLNIWDYELLMRFMKEGVDFPKDRKYENR